VVVVDIIKKKIRLTSAAECGIKKLGNSVKFSHLITITLYSGINFIIHVLTVDVSLGL
jgi:hypothetical protein